MTTPYKHLKKADLKFVQLRKVTVFWIAFFIFQYPYEVPEIIITKPLGIADEEVQR